LYSKNNNKALSPLCGDDHINTWALKRSSYRISFTNAEKKIRTTFPFISSALLHKAATKPFD